MEGHARQSAAKSFAVESSYGLRAILLRMSIDHVERLPVAHTRLRSSSPTSRRKSAARGARPGIDELGAAKRASNHQADEVSQ